MEEKNANEILKFGKQFYEIFQKIQKCAFVLECDCYIFGHIIHQLLSRNDIYNPEKMIGVIYVGEKKDLLKSTITKFFDRPIRFHDYGNLVAYGIKEGYHLFFYFIPDFSPDQINGERGFTIDQIYYRIKDNKLFDTTGEGLSHFLSSPIIIKNTADPEKWNKAIVFNFLLKIGTYYDSEIAPDDFEKLLQIKIDGLENLGVLLWLNRPGTAIRTLFELFPKSEMWFFDALLKLMSYWGIGIKETVQPSKVLSEEKLKLLDLYSDYFNSSGSLQEKRDRGKLLAKILVDI